MNANHDERISAYLDGELTAEERRSFERDLVNSNELRDRLDEIRAIDSALRALPPLSNDDATSRRAERLPQVQRARKTAWPALLAGALCLAAGFLFQASLTDPTQPAATEAARIAPAWTHDRTAVASLVFSVGSPSRIPNASKDFAPLAIGAPIRTFDTLLLDSGVSAVVELRDGARLWIDENAAVSFDETGAPQIHRGRTVITTAPSSTLRVEIGGTTITLEDGACETAFETVAAKKVAPGSPRLRLVVSRGAVTIGERRFLAGASLLLDDEVISEGHPPLDSRWFLELATRAAEPN